MKKKMETSKLILLVLFISSVIFISFNMYLSLKTHDTGPMITIADGLFRLLSVAVGFYYWKSRSENIRKYNKSIQQEQAEQTEGGNSGHNGYF